MLTTLLSSSRFSLRSKAQGNRQKLLMSFAHWFEQDWGAPRLLDHRDMVLWRILVGRNRSKSVF